MNNFDRIVTWAAVGWAVVFLLIYAMMSTAKADILPSSVVMVNHDTKTTPCYSSYWWYSGGWAVPFQADMTRCGESAIDTTGMGVYANVMMRLHSKTVIAYTFDSPVRQFVIRRCFGCGDVANMAGEVDVSIDQASWIRTANWTRDIPAEGPSVVIWKMGTLIKAHIQEEATVTLPAASQVVYIRGVKYATPGGATWYPDIFSVKGRNMQTFCGGCHK
jgi:hypothetical protein